MLLNLAKENDELREQLAAAQKQLEDRSIAIEPVGSLAEAALKLNGVFESAQAACEQYLHNVLKRSQQIEETCDRIELETKQKCDLMLEEAKKQADTYLKEAMLNTEQPKDNDLALNSDSEN